MTKIKTDHTNVGYDIKELELSHTASMNVKMVQHFEKQFDSFVSFFKMYLLFKIEVYLIHKIILVSCVQHSDSKFL